MPRKPTNKRDEKLFTHLATMVEHLRDQAKKESATRGQLMRHIMDCPDCANGRCKTAIEMDRNCQQAISAGDLIASRLLKHL
jgi:hypothetical protein